MKQRNVLKLIHLVSTIWLMLCLAFVLMIALRQAGFNWWVIFSLSGPSALMTFLLVCVYLFAFFGAAGKEQRNAIEHPLTSTSFYMGFYVSIPLLGAAGVIAIPEITGIGQFFSSMAMGTFAATFLTWVVVDPVISLSESFLPAARAHRRYRLADIREKREQQQLDLARQVEEVLHQQEQLQSQWKNTFKSQAEELSNLLGCSQKDFEHAEQMAIEIGVHAWRTGGLACMRQLRNMAMELSKANRQIHVIGDYVTYWWDGIGTWRSRMTN
jgi:hypothetical protein